MVIKAFWSLLLRACNEKNGGTTRTTVGENDDGIVESIVIVNICSDTVVNINQKRLYSRNLTGIGGNSSESLLGRNCSGSNNGIHVARLYLILGHDF